MQPSGGSIASGSVAALPAALVTFAGQQSAANTADLSIGAAASVGFAGASIASGICQINAAAILVGANTAGSISKLGDDGDDMLMRSQVLWRDAAAAEQKKQDNAVLVANLEIISAALAKAVEQYLRN